jgi:hypothetical protein
MKRIYLLASSLPLLLLLALSIGATEVDAVWATIFSFDFTSSTLDSKLFGRSEPPEWLQQY